MTSSTRQRALCLTAAAAAFLSLAGCEAVALTAFGVGASTGVQHGLNGIAYRTFTAPATKVKGATLTALNRMSIRVQGTGKGEEGEVIRARASDRQIEVELQALSPNTTRMRTVARQGLFYDSATAYEIIIQTEKILGNNA
jgi:hypothetical protein